LIGIPCAMNAVINIGRRRDTFIVYIERKTPIIPTQLTIIESWNGSVDPAIKKKYTPYDNKKDTPVAGCKRTSAIQSKVRLWTN